MAFYFLKLPEGTVYDYFQLKALPEFNDPNDTPGWPDNGFISSLDGILNPYGIYRLYDTPKPAASQPYKIVEKGSPQYVVNGDYYDWNWVERNMTQTELDALNAERKSVNDFNRGMRYQAEADPLYFKAQRGETTEQEWLDKVAEIKSDLPDPAIIALP